MTPEGMRHAASLALDPDIADLLRAMANDGPESFPVAYPIAVALADEILRANA